MGKGIMMLMNAFCECKNNGIYGIVNRYEYYMLLSKVPSVARVPHTISHSQSVYRFSIKLFQNESDRENLVGERTNKMT